MKTKYIHTHQKCMVTFVKEVLVDRDTTDEELEAILEEGDGNLVGVSIGDGFGETTEDWHDEPNLPSLFYAEPEPQVRRVLDISTAHISEATSDLLGVWAELGTYPGAPIVYGRGEYGHMVYVPSELPKREDRPLYPADLWEVVLAAHKRNCDWIIFDRDGATVPYLETFDW